MLIDFHIHAFTDEIAERAVGKLKVTAGIPSYSDGTVSDTAAKLRETNVDNAVLLPIATKPKQQVTINNWAAGVNGKYGLISFGTVHPSAEDAVEELHRLKDLGLKGIKLHPDYQGVFLFDEAAVNVMRECALLKLPVIIHMGYDPVSPLVHHAMPQDLLYVHEKLPDLILIGAHMGGMNAWEAVYHYLAGVENVYFDTAYTAGNISPELMTQIIKKHGAEKILFGSDLPWHSPAMEYKFISDLDLPDNDKDRIFSLNARELLDI